MNTILTVARKEAGLIIRSRQLMVSALFVTVIFSGTATIGSGAEGGASVGALIFMVITVTGIFMSYIFSGQVFLRDKIEGMSGTLPCPQVSHLGDPRWKGHSESS